MGEENNKEDLYLLGCLFAVNHLIEKGSSEYAVRIDGKWHTVPWSEIREWIEKQYGITDTATSTKTVQ